MQPAVCPRCRNPTPMPPPSNCATCGEPFKKAVVIPLTPAIGTSGPRGARLAGGPAEGKGGGFTPGGENTPCRQPKKTMRLLHRRGFEENPGTPRGAGRHFLAALPPPKRTFI